MLFVEFQIFVILSEAKDLCTRSTTQVLRFAQDDRCLILRRRQISGCC
jgi:hypothetical protein